MTTDVSFLFNIPGTDIDLVVEGQYWIDPGDRWTPGDAGFDATSIHRPDNGREVDEDAIIRLAKMSVNKDYFNPDKLTHSWLWSSFFEAAGEAATESHYSRLDDIIDMKKQ